MIQAVERYDATRDNKLITYAAFRIKGAVLSELRSRDFISRSNRKKVREMEKACLKLEKELGREVEGVEVAEELGIGLDQYYDIKKISGISFISFDDIGCSSNREKEKIIDCLADNCAGYSDDPFTLIRLKEIQTVVAKAIEELPEKEKMVVSLYYMDELTMKEIGNVLNITESRVSQIHSRAIIHIREKLRDKKMLED